jgi:hypothetical protein
MSKTNIQITMEDGSVWSVKISDVAKNRDDCYFRNDSAEYFHAYPYEALDWLNNNTNWGDVEAVKVKDAPAPDYSEFYNCPSELI